MKGIIVDNDQNFILKLTSLCETFENIEIVKKFNNKLEAASFLQNNNIDFMVVDVDLPVAESLDIYKSLSNVPKTIIATNNRHFALKAYEYNFVIDYVLKPMCPERYGLSFLRLAKDIAERNLETFNFPDKLFINVDKKLIKINLEDILFIQSKGDYITIHTENRNYTTYASLKKVYNRLTSHQFVNIHRSYIVNIDKIVDLDQNSMVVGKDVLSISRYKRNYLMERLNHL